MLEGGLKDVGDVGLVATTALTTDMFIKTPGSVGSVGWWLCVYPKIIKHYDQSWHTFMIL